MNHLNWSRNARIALTVTLITFCDQTLHAADWGGGTSTDWNTAANWSDNAVPTGVDANIFAGAGNFSVISATPTGAPKAVWIGNYGAATGRLDLTGGALTVTNTDWPGGPLIVGYGQDGKGTCNITGTASLTTGSFGDIRVGSGFWWGNSTGVLNVNTTGTVHANGHLAIGGQNGDVGTVNVDAGSISVVGGWQTSVDIAAGSATSPSSGSLNISGGTLAMDHRLVIAAGFRSGDGEANPYVYANGSYVGTVTMTGGTLTTDATHNENWHGGLSMAAGFDEATGGTATFNLDGGTLSTLFVFTEAGNNGVAGTSIFNFNGGTLQGQANYGQFMGGLTRANVRDGGAVINTNGFDLNIGQVLMHSDIGTDAPVDGGLTKKGLGQLTVSSAFTYTGDTKVDAGTLTVQTDSFDDASAIRIASGAILNLNTGATDIVEKLYFGATQQAAGTWGATGSGATHIDDTHFTGNGVLSVTTAGVAGYMGWANANGATGQTKDLDHDNDGVDNGIEYFMGKTGSTFTANPAAVGGTITWPMSAIYTGVYGTDYEVQYSTNLVIWTQAPIGIGDNTVVVTPGTSVVYDVPTGGKSFVRLVVKN